MIEEQSLSTSFVKRPGKLTSELIFKYSLVEEYTIYVIQKSRLIVKDKFSIQKMHDYTQASVTYISSCLDIEYLYIYSLQLCLAPYFLGKNMLSPACNYKGH